MHETFYIAYTGVPMTEVSTHEQHAPEADQQAAGPRRPGHFGGPVPDGGMPRASPRAPAQHEEYEEENVA
jgi:hypothetical protein